MAFHGLICIRQGAGKRKRHFNYKILNLLETHNGGTSFKKKDTMIIYEKQDLYLI